MEEFNTGLIDRYVEFKNIMRSPEVYSKNRKLDNEFRKHEMVLGPIANKVLDDFGIKNGFSLISMCKVTLYTSTERSSFMDDLFRDKIKVLSMINQALNDVPSISFLEDPIVELYVQQKGKPLKELLLDIIKIDSKGPEEWHPNSLLRIALESGRSLRIIY